MMGQKGRDALTEHGGRWAALLSSFGDYPGVANIREGQSLGKVNIKQRNYEMTHRDQRHGNAGAVRELFSKVCMKGVLREERSQGN